MPDLPTFIGRYRVVERLSSGGMGVLYLARDPAIDRTVAIKVARVHSVELRQRFLREARATGRLNHRNIVTIFDVGEHAGEPFIAMEYVPGRTLAEIVRGNTPLPLLRRLRMLRELCDGLAYAHSQSIIHRDVKPANLISRENSGALTILDFGIARLSDALTSSGPAMIGTPNYMAPEQIDGVHIDHRCDIFAVGLVFYELLSYRRAFGGDSPTAVIYKIVHEQPVPLAEVVPDLDSGLIRAIDRALAKRADDRYQHLSELIADLDAAIVRIEEEERERDSTILVRREDQAPAPCSSGSGPRTSRAELVARREAQFDEASGRRERSARQGALRCCAGRGRTGRAPRPGRRSRTADARTYRRRPPRAAGRRAPFQRAGPLEGAGADASVRERRPGVAVAAGVSGGSATPARHRDPSNDQSVAGRVRAATCVGGVHRRRSVG